MVRESPFVFGLISLACKHTYYHMCLCTSIHQLLIYCLPLSCCIRLFSLYTSFVILIHQCCFGCVFCEYFGLPVDAAIVHNNYNVRAILQCAVQRVLQQQKKKTEMLLKTRKKGEENALNTRNCKQIASVDADEKWNPCDSYVDALCV